MVPDIEREWIARELRSEESLNGRERRRSPWWWIVFLLCALAALILVTR